MLLMRPKFAIANGISLLTKSNAIFRDRCAIQEIIDPQIRETFFCGAAIGFERRLICCSILIVLLLLEVQSVICMSACGNNYDSLLMQ